MILKKLYISPDMPFGVVEFSQGINIILGEKDNPGNNGDTTVNGIGKSTFFDLIDFALMSDFSEEKKPRLYFALEKGLLKGKSVVLHFEASGIEYTIKRGFDTPAKILFNFNNTEKELGIKDARIFLGETIFGTGEFSHYFRTLIRFFIKINKSKKTPYVDPIEYDDFMKKYQIMPFHLFLLNIDNKLASENSKIQNSKSDLLKARKALKKFLVTRYGSDKGYLEQAESEVAMMKKKMDEIKKSIDGFEMFGSYNSINNEINTITESIKNLWFKVKGIEQEQDEINQILSKNSYNVNIKRIEELYNDTNMLLTTNVIASLSEAIKFRKDLISSRKDFLISYSAGINTEALRLNEEVKLLDKKRGELYKLLNNKDGIQDLISGFKFLAQTQDAYAILTSQLGGIHQLQQENLLLNNQENLLNQEILKSKESIDNSLHEFYILANEIYDYIYDSNIYNFFNYIINIENSDKIFFSILPGSKKESTGINHVRTLIYDISVILYRGIKNIKGPNFLCHDGIFDSTGIDTEQKMNTIKYIINHSKKNKNFQYILSLNYDNLNLEEFSPEDINIILKLSPSRKLLGNF